MTTALLDRAIKEPRSEVEFDLIGARGSIAPSFDRTGQDSRPDEDGPEIKGLDVLEFYQAVILGLRRTLSDRFVRLGELYEKFESLLARESAGEDVSLEIQQCETEISALENQEAVLSEQLLRSELAVQPEESAVILEDMLSLIEDLREDNQGHD